MCENSFLTLDRYFKNVYKSMLLTQFRMERSLSGSVIFSYCRITFANIWSSAKLKFNHILTTESRSPITLTSVRFRGEHLKYERGNDTEGYTITLLSKTGSSLSRGCCRARGNMYGEHYTANVKFTQRVLRKMDERVRIRPGGPEPRRARTQMSALNRQLNRCIRSPMGTFQVQIVCVIRLLSNNLHIDRDMRA